LLNYVDINKNNIPKLDIEDYKRDAKYLANEVRSYFNLGRKPIENFVHLLEKNGVIIYFYDYDFISQQLKTFDGVSFYVSGVPVILINNKIQNARKMFTLAHELGHLIMHNHNDFIIPKDRNVEKEANVFASEFIAPENALRGEFARLTLEKLFLLKSYWKLSIGALLYKAKSMTLTDYQYRRWVTRLAPYRKHEPHDFDLDKPVLLKRMFEVTKEDIGSDMFFEDLYLSKFLFEEIYSTLIEKQRPKLRIIL
jgi:Zn-dependent peptidase ImmA (M78 family)